MTSPSSPHPVMQGIVSWLCCIGSALRSACFVVDFGMKSREEGEKFNMYMFRYNTTSTASFYS